MLVSPDELASLRELAESGMQTSVSIYAQTSAETANGRQASYATSATTAIGWLTELTSNAARLGMISGGIEISETHRLMLPVGTACVVGDKVVIAGQEYIVQHTNEGDTYQTSLTCLLRSIPD
jgi:hypothetical protein